MFYAHSRPDLPKEKWQTLEEHLAEVGSLAGRFARKWDAEVLGVITREVS
ncbi:hypothetical protein [Spirochaeta thermophila]|nr:hypothetical protein [Spirochaeta thermophila]